MKKILYLLIPIFLFSCSEEELLSFDNTNKTDDSNLSLKHGGDSLYDALGHGLDVTKEYLGTEKAQVIDNEKIELLEPTRIKANDNNLQHYFLLTGATAYSYLKELSTKKKINTSGTYNIYSANFKGTFENSSSHKYTNDYSYGEYHLMIQKKEYRYTFGSGEVGLSDLRKYVTDDFKSDLERKSLQEIVELYGTHIYTHVILGGKLTIRYSSMISSWENSESKKQTIEGGMGVNIPQIFKFNASTEIINTENTHLANKNTNQKLTYETKGGDSRFGVVGEISFNKNPIDKVDVSKWQESCTNGHANLIDFEPGTLLPLWELVEDVTKRETLKNYIIKYIQDNEFQDIPGGKVIPDRLRTNEKLLPDQYLQSQNKLYKLIFQKDGNLVLYSHRSNRVIWAINRNFSNPKQFILQGDGNMVIYDQSNRGCWSSLTHTVGDKAQLVVQDDGNMVLYDRFNISKWTTNTWMK